MNRTDARAGARGQSLVEMALMLPILLLLLIGIVDLGRAYYSKITITNVAREGTRYASRFPQDKEGIINAARQEALNGGIPTDTIRIFIDPDPVEAVPAMPGQPITVTTEYDFETIFGGIIGLPDGFLTLRSEAKMVVFGTEGE